MTRSPFRPLPPAWFYAALLAVIWAALHVLGLHALEAPQVQLAFFGWLVAIAQAVWVGITAISHATLVALGWTINALWLIVRQLGNGLAEFGRQFLKGGREAWQFLRDTYQHVLKPAWMKFWRLVDWARHTLERIFGPVIEFLRTVRREFLKFYDRFVRPVLDAIGIARKVLRVFSSLGADWARALDRELAKLEEKIDAPFRLLLRELNAVINVVNRIVTADGLFQRLALVRSIERDILVLSRSFFRLTTRPLTAEQRGAGRDAAAVKTPAQHADELRLALTTRDGPIAYAGEEFVADLRIMLNEGRAR